MLHLGYSAISTTGNLIRLGLRCLWSAAAKDLCRGELTSASYLRDDLHPYAITPAGYNPKSIWRQLRTCPVLARLNAGVSSKSCVRIQRLPPNRESKEAD
jgi:hypothetical protein